VEKSIKVGIRMAKEMGLASKRTRMVLPSRVSILKDLWKG
jgi:hypothetical protein